VRVFSWQRLWETAALGPTERFQAISIQFALHYMFKTEETALNFFRSISDRLVAGGVLLITVPDANVLIRRIRNLPEGELEFGNDLWVHASLPHVSCTVCACFAVRCLLFVVALVFLL
jgi:hypothetical protein